MATELIYTSAPAGLKPGTYGFCVVACTRGLKESYATALQSLSGYRRLFSPESGRERQNPVVYANYVVEIGGVPTRVLSRVGDAGYDYSNRTNKIAHHLILSNSELASAGPAALFAVPNLFVERWDSKPTYIEQEKKIPTPTEAPLRGFYWKELTGDSEWARALAATVSTNRSVVLIVRPDCDVLRLYREALELLPPKQRWNATFSTYFTSVPPGVRCQWKAVITGSPEEEQLRARRDALIVDLTDPRKTGELAKFVANLPNWRLKTQATSKPERRAVPKETNVSAPRTVAPTTLQVSEHPKVYSLRAEDVLTTGVPIKPKPIRKKLNYGRDAVLPTDVPVKKSRSYVIIAALSGAVCAAITATICLFFVCPPDWAKPKDPAPKDRSSANASPCSDSNIQPITNSSTGQTAPASNPQENDSNPDGDANSDGTDSSTGQEATASNPQENDSNPDGDANSNITYSSTEPEAPASNPQKNENDSNVDANRNFGVTGSSTEQEAIASNPQENENNSNRENDEKDEKASVSDQNPDELLSAAFETFKAKWESENIEDVKKISFSPVNRKSEGNSQGEIEERIEGIYAESLKDLAEICRKSKRPLQLSICLLGSTSKKPYYFKEGGLTSYTDLQKFEFGEDDGSGDKEVEFKLIQQEKSTTHKITFKINENGVLSLNFSDQEIRDYFLLYVQIQWSVNTDAGPMQSRYITLLEVEKSYFPQSKQDDKTLSFDIELKEAYEKTENPKPKWKFPNQINTKKGSEVYLIVELESKSKQLKVSEKNGKYLCIVNDLEFDVSSEDGKDKGIRVITFKPSDNSPVDKKILDQIKDSIVKDLTIKVYLGDKDGRTLLKVIKGKQPEESGDKSNSN